ncbi:hypothetical protein FLA_1291 [Filimonas lacunae]|nr:hypothetical protein FLA_1291 [Filimonas lacunae]
MLCHLAALAGFFFWPGNVLGPLIVWQLKKNELPEIDEHGKAAFNFQLTLFIVNVIVKFVLASTVGYHVFWGAPFLAFGSGFGLLTVLSIINVIGWVLAIVAGIRANNGELYKYPFSYRFVR